MTPITLFIKDVSPKTELVLISLAAAAASAVTAAP
jgi:hypothetical protein